MSTQTCSEETSGPYVIACTVHGVKRYFDGADFGQRDEAEEYPTKQAAKAAARDCTYPVVLERAS